MGDEEINEQFLEIMMSNRIGLDEDFNNIEFDELIIQVPTFVVVAIPQDIYDVWVLFLELYGNRNK
ncbi:MAG: hypothetical protein Tp156SUR915002_33 [Prokaryotic dsDNA virus sp.]|jgi:flavodoxin|nr:MAG: hypothetical protein Tp162SUR384061_42 [Prokaryotic dsDNA virus sp.]QDP59772.1 MAG: hypothetical protein Tp156SUR915002_33 [Prokaryotic dsDNA virus sp.]|tara:strand:- start:15654 stop:15851 length:198 start_codon:yes stop_codon:yes gene_type:complete